MEEGKENKKEIEKDLKALDEYLKFAKFYEDSEKKFSIAYRDNIKNDSELRTPARIINTTKEIFTKPDIKQRIFMIMHEFMDEWRSKMPPRPYIDHEAEQKKYFENFPFDEQAVRDFLQCKKEKGYFENIDVQTAKLSDMLSYPNYGYGFRILNVTVGKGTHNTNMYGGHTLLDTNYEVNEDEVYITYNTTQMLSGGKFTAVMQRKDGKNEIIKGYTHSRS